MTKISLTSMGITFIGLTFIFIGFKFGFALLGNSGYDVSNVNGTLFDEIGDEDLVNTYINDTSSSIEDNTQTDQTLFDVIGGLIATAITPVRVILGGANFLITNLGRLLSFIGIPRLFNDYVTGLISFIIGTIFLFKLSH